MPPPAPTGWYPDPKQPSRERYWDGEAWTTHTRSPAASQAAPVGAPANDDPPNRGWPSTPSQAEPGGPPGGGEAASGGPPLPLDAPLEPERRPTSATVGLIALGAVIVGGAIAAVLYLTGVLDSGDGASEAAVSERTTTQDDAAAEDVPGDAPDAARDAGPADADEQTAGGSSPVDDLSELDPRQLTYTIRQPGGAVAEVELDQGVAILDGGEHLRLVDELVAFGDVTGDGAAELVAAFAIERTSGGEVVARPAISVLTLRDREVVHLDPPPLGGSGPTAEQGLVDALGIVDGGLEVRVMTPPRGQEVVEVVREHADPYASNVRAETRLDHQDGVWHVSDDGPITRAVRQYLGAEGVTVQANELWCSGSAERRGQRATCHLLAHDRPFDTVELLVVDDDGSFRAAQVDEGTATSASDVRAALGPGEHFCRDIEEHAGDAPTPWVLPMAAVSYWFDEGMPDRMDAAQNGVPCETVFDDVAAFLDGRDGQVTETYLLTVGR